MYQPNIPKVGFSVDNYKQDQFEKYFVFFDIVNITKKKNLNL